MNMGATKTSPYKRGWQFTIRMVLSIPVVIWCVPLALMRLGLSFQETGMIQLPLMFGWLAIVAIGSFRIVCPACRRSVFMRSGWHGASWPVRTCSKCGRDLTVP